MSYAFETVVRRGPENLKQLFTPREVLQAGLVSFDGAEPDYPTAPVIREAVARLAENGLFGFTLADDSYREAVRWWMENSRGVRIDPEWIVPTLGTIHALSSAIRLLVHEGEQMLVMPPVYNRFQQAADRLGRKTVFCPLTEEDTRYRMDLNRLEDILRANPVRLIVLCNPHNPIGRIWREEELRGLLALAVRYDVRIFSDEIFADNCYQGLRCPSLLSLPQAGDRVLVSTSLGKAFGLTGLNHANVLIPDEALRRDFEDRRTRDHYGSMDPAAYACVKAGYSLEGLDWVRASNRVCEENIRLVRQALGRFAPSARVFGGEGAYVLWVDMRSSFPDEETMLDFLVHRALFHVDGGSAYGGPGWFRMCVASPAHCVRQALERLENAWKHRTR